MLQVIFFDAAGTLIRLPRSVGSHYAEVARACGIDLAAAAWDQAFRTAWRQMPARTSDAGPRPDDDKGWWRELVAGVVDRVVPEDRSAALDFDAFFDTLYAHFAQPGVWALYPEVAEVLAALRERGLRLAVISNFDRRLLTILRNLEIAPYFEQIVLSSEAGADKPDPRIFALALERMAVDPARAWHIGDDPARDGGAAAAGIRVFHLERPAMSLLDLWTNADFVKMTAGDGSGGERGN